MPPYGSIDHPRETASRPTIRWSFNHWGPGDPWLLGLVSYAALGSLVGVAVGAVEILQRYRDAPFRAVFNGWGIGYVVLNAAVSYGAFWVLYHWLDTPQPMPPGNPIPFISGARRRWRTESDGRAAGIIGLHCVLRYPLEEGWRIVVPDSPANPNSARILARRTANRFIRKYPGGAQQAIEDFERRWIDSLRAPAADSSPEPESG